MDRMISREGFALPAALLALIVVGALVTGGMYAAMEEDRSSANVDHGHLAFLAAERGLADVFGTKTRPYFQDEIGPVGAVDTIGPVAITVNGMQAQYTAYVRRVSSRVFKVDSEGEVLSGGRYAGSRRQLSQMMRISYTHVPKDRAVTSFGPMRTRGKTGIVGVDSIAPGWTGCTDVGTQSAVQAPTDDPQYIDIKGNPGLVGSPQIKEDPTMDSLDFVEYGDMQLDDLKEWADIKLAPGNYNGIAPAETGGVCDKSLQLNWGDPKNPSGACHLYWPIIYVPGDLDLQTGVGQGILIVDGNLKVAGDVEFSGLVFVYGGLQMAGSGNHFSGSVNVFANGDTTDIDNTGSGISQIRLSSCAIERAHMYNDRFARPIPLGLRKFVDVSALGVE